MKKILALAVGMLLIPFTAFGMEAMSDGDMDSITGQSGVAISLDNIQIYSSSNDETWFETSLGTTDSGAAVGLVSGDNSYSYMFINKIADPLGAAKNGGAGFGNVGDQGDLTSAGSIDWTGKNESLRGDYDGLKSMWDSGELSTQGMRTTPSVLSIRVAQHHDEGVFGGSVDDLRAAETGEVKEAAYVEIGLPTLEIYSAEGSVDELKIFVVGEGSYGGTDSANPVGTNDQTFSLGTMWTSDNGGTTAIMGGRIGITSLGSIPGDFTSSSYKDEGGL